MDAQPAVALRRGWELYRAHLARPEVAGGASARSRQHYGAIMDKFIPFAEQHSVHDWGRVTAKLVADYLAHLQQEQYAERTLYAEGTVIKQAMRWLVQEQHIPHAALLKLSLRKVHGSDRYCYSVEQVAAMVAHCEQDARLHWLRDVVLLLSRTGVRISELSQLRWSDFDLSRNVLRIVNDRNRRVERADQRRTKNRRDRSFPIQDELRAIFERLPHRADGYVLHGPRGGRLKPDTVRNTLITEVITPLKKTFSTARGEIGFEHGRLHSFRHFFCSRCPNESVPPQIVMNWLGHASSEMVRLYYHLSDPKAQRQMKRVNFTGAAGGSVAVGPAPDSQEVSSAGQINREAS